MPAQPDPREPRPRAQSLFEQHLTDVQLLLARQRRVEALVEKQETPRHGVVEDLVHRQHLVELHNLLRRLSAAEIARLIEVLPEEDRLTTWQEVEESRGELVLEFLPDELRAELLAARPLHGAPSSAVSAFELRNGRLSQARIARREDLATVAPIWIDLVAPSAQVRAWVGEFFDLYLPDPEDVDDIEESARFYIDDNGAVHLSSNFLLSRQGVTRNVPVAFILHRNILFSVRNEELPVFRLQRLRARTQPGYVSDGKDVLLDLFGADVEYSADTLEETYAELERVGRQVLSPQVSDDEAAEILAEIAKGEDLNGRIRRNVLDTRRALSFLMRGRLLEPEQHEDARQILRDIESLDGHTSFLFNKINFLMDAAVGFININQNKRVSKLTAITVVFVPINIIAGIGGMSEFSMMTQGIPWPISYGAFTVAMALLGFGTYHALRYFERREAAKRLAARRSRSA
ncbi:MAG: CorA family divalent cation transporter [Pseudomonadota bacterium]|uniref:magnesium and cobalt transport protein CorA n=1 Tax=Sulfuricystis thermophila TaxID=2496847 RepID=UPI001036D9B8|nr:magnesium and cobalt transport protein CorA [Sulfuricystis thermophila]MDI6751027.1 magnesium and cobalt transport protein CorA [Rhodocyclaceae bacterium]